MSLNKESGITIAIPFFNAESYLLNAIKSVFCQTYENWELILLDDGSRDRSADIAKSIADERVRVISDGRNMGLAARLNQIPSLARHDFIARMDADDLMARDRISKQMAFLKLHPEIDLVTTGVCTITDKLMPDGLRVPARGHRLRPRDLLTAKHHIVHASILGRRAWFERNRYDPSDLRGQDYNLWIKAFLKDDFAIGFLKEPLYFYREVGSMNVGKMLLGQSMIRSAVRRHGAKMVGFDEAVKIHLLSNIKSAVIGMSELLSITDRIVESRAVALKTVEKDILRREILQIMDFDVPISMGRVRCGGSELKHRTDSYL